MHSILRNVSLLKTTFAQKHSSSLNILEYSSIFPKISRYAIRPPLIVEHMKNSTLSSKEYVTKINKHYSWINIPKNKHFSSPLTKISYRTNQKFRRYFCQNTQKKSERGDIKRRQLDKNEQLKKDGIYAENCITAREEKCKKKLKKRRGDIKFTVNLNNIINEMNKKKNVEKQHEINKINNFIFKPIDCKSCSQKRRSNSKKCKHVTHQKRTNSSYSGTKKYYPKYEKKQELFQRQYAEPATFKPRLELLAFLNDNKNEKGAFLVKSKCNFTNLRSKSSVPLFLLVKCNSTKSKTMNNFTRNVKYKVGTNQALLKVSSKTKKSDTNLMSPECQHQFVNNYKDSNNQIANFNGIFNSTEKLKENKLQLYQYPSEMNSLTTKPVLAKAIYEMLRPLIQQEYLQYKEVKEAIERLERTLQYHFNKSRTKGSECRVYKSLSNTNQLRTKQSQLNLPNKKNNEINDPKSDLEIKDPLDTNNKKGDPSTNSSISVPCIRKENIFDPVQYEITIIAKDCFEKNKTNGGCDGNTGSQDKNKDPCEKKSKKEPCKQEKDDPCKKAIEEKRKDDPCQETKKECSKCDLNKGKDLCSKNKEDLCKDKQKNDHCKDKKPPTPKKKTDPCNKKEPCNKKDTCKDNSSIKDDDCFKLGSLKNKQPKSISNDHSCMMPKKRIDHFVATPTSCDGNKKNIRKNICKKPDQSCKNNKEDPCKSFKERSNLKNKDQCGQIGLKKENPCKPPKEVTICKGIEQNEDKEDCMKPSEVTCPKGNSIKPRPCCEEVSICEEPKLPVIKPTCEEEPKKNLMEDTEKGPNYCKQVPMPMDCPMKIDAEGKSKHGEPVSCTQRSCSQKSMEPTEPPNCCKPRPKSVGEKCSRTFKSQQVVQEKPEVRQISCQELIKQQEKSALSKAPPFPSPPKSSQSKKGKPKCPPPSKSDTRYCTKSTKKKEEYVPEQAKPAKIKAKVTCDENILQKPFPESREPRQAAKDSWAPVKIKGKNSKLKCQLRHAKSAIITKTEKASDTSATFSRDEPKEKCSKKSFLDSCKGIFSNVCGMLCPGKNKKSGKKAASLGLIRSMSLPEIRGLTGGALSGSSGNNYRKKKPGTMSFAHYKTKDRYPWRSTNRWILRNERFFSKRNKKSDVCETKNEEIAPESNKLNCICYEEMKKTSQKGMKNQNGAEDTCGKMGDTENKKEPTKLLNFKLTDHSKICQAANKTKVNSKNEKCESHSRRDQSIFNQCGDLTKNMNSGNVEKETVQSDNSSNDTRTIKEEREQSCINKLKTCPEAKGKEEPKEKIQEQQKSCIEKLKTMKKEGSTEEEQKKTCLDKLKPSTKAIGKDEPTARKRASSASSSKRNTLVRNKYPWQKSADQMDAELCPNQSAITAGSSEENHANENTCSKPKTEEVGRNIMEKGKGDQDKKKKYNLEVGKDSSCFKGQIKHKSENDKDSDICKKIGQNQAPRSGDSNTKENICAKLNSKETMRAQEKGKKLLKNNEEGIQGNQNKEKKYNLNNKKDPCCFKRPQNQSQSDVDKQKDQSKKDIKCPNSDGESTSKKQKYNLDSRSRDTFCFKNQKRKTEPDDQANKESRKDTKCPNSDGESKSKKQKYSHSRETSRPDEKEIVSEKGKVDKECEKETMKNFLENYTKKVEKILKSGENSSGNHNHDTPCGKENTKDGRTVKTKDKNNHAGQTTEDICPKMMQKHSPEQKTKEEDNKNKCQKQIAQSSSRQKDSLNLDQFILNENEEDVFICKVKKLGKSEQFICNPKGDECKMSKPEKGVVRVLKCKLTKDDCGRDVFVCKEIKPKTAEDEELKLKQRLPKQRSSPELPSKKMSVGKKLVCTQETSDDNKEVNKELTCDVREVREIIEGNEIKKESCDNSNKNKKSPFTYKDLLKKSEEIRKRGNAEVLKKDRPEKKKDCKDKSKIRNNFVAIHKLVCFSKCFQ